MLCACEMFVLGFDEHTVKIACKVIGRKLVQENKCFLKVFCLLVLDIVFQSACYEGELVVTTGSLMKNACMCYDRAGFDMPIQWILEKVLNENEVWMTTLSLDSMGR